MITATTVSEQQKQMKIFWQGVETLSEYATLATVQTQLEETYGIKTTSSIIQYSLVSPCIVDEDKYLLFLLKFA
jgi:hypothetical protein